MIDTAYFTGQWIGEQPDHDDPRTWHMLIQGPWVCIEQHDARDVCIDRLDGVISDYDPPFSFGLKVLGMRVTALDPDHLLVRLNEQRSVALAADQAADDAGEGEDDINVLFSRPGLPELTAGQVYHQYQTECHGPVRMLFITRWATP